MLGELGAETVSADELVHDLLAADPETIAAVRERFGNEVVRESGVDRPALAAEVFGDEAALQHLEEILHPRVREETGRRALSSEAELFVVEIPLLFEGGRSSDFDATVAIIVPEERRRAWISGRGIPAAQLAAIEARQLTGEEKAHRADYVVENDGGPDKLRDRAARLKAELLSRFGEKGSGGGEDAGEKA